MKDDRTQDSEAFERLLRWLGPTRETAAAKYEDIRRKLIYMFTCRGCHVPEELADETIDRVTQVLAKPDFSYAGNPYFYFHGVARNVHLEWLRKSRRVVIEPLSDTNLKIGMKQPAQPDNERIFQCLDKCLARLPFNKRALLLEYYQQEKKTKIYDRKRMAQHGFRG